MKKCPKCEKIYDDNEAVCSSCNVPLEICEDEPSNESSRVLSIEKEGGTTIITPKKFLRKCPQCGKEYGTALDTKCLKCHVPLEVHENGSFKPATISKKDSIITIIPKIWFRKCSKCGKAYGFTLDKECSKCHIPLVKMTQDELISMKKLIEKWNFFIFLFTVLLFLGVAGIFIWYIQKYIIHPRPAPYKQIQRVAVKGDKKSIEKKELPEDIKKKIFDSRSIFLLAKADKLQIYVTEKVFVEIKMYVKTGEKIELKDVEYPFYPHNGFIPEKFESSKGGIEIVKGVEYDTLVFQQYLIGLEPGNYSLDPISLKFKLVIKSINKEKNVVKYPVELKIEGPSITVLPKSD